MFGIGVPELIIILLICLLIFGADKLPGLGKSLAKTISEFKKGMKETEGHAKEGSDSVKGTEADEKNK